MERCTIADLPSIEECHEFMAAINTGRRAIGLDEIDKLDYDRCTPNQGYSCLSAHHLFVRDQAEVAVSTTTVVNVPMAEARTLSNVFDVELGLQGPLGLPLGQCRATIDIPSAILRITRVFDASHNDPHLHAALRDRLAEADLIESVMAPNHASFMDHFFTDEVPDEVPDDEVPDEPLVAVPA